MDEPTTRYEQYKRDERANNMAEVIYWREQYKQLCADLIAAHEVPVQMTPQQVWPSVPSPRIDEEVPGDTPVWMEDTAIDIATEFTEVNHFGKRERLKSEIIRAMKEASREVALFFAANPKGTP